MRQPIIQADRLVKWHGSHLAVRDVSFSVNKGEIVGLLGPNGSGKSTIFRILTGSIAPTSGTARVAGHDAVTDALALRRDVGYVPEDAPVYDTMRVAEFLRFMARLKGLDGLILARRINEVAARLRLEKVMDFPAATLSRGSRQLVSIAQALLNDPRVLVFDEPTSGLDPGEVIAVRTLIRELAGKRTVLIASHILSEMQQIADRIMILLDGKLLTTDALGQTAAVRHLRLEAVGNDQDIRGAINTVTGIRTISARYESGATRYLIEADDRPRLSEEIAGALFARRIGLSELATIKPDLEQIYLGLTRAPAEAAREAS
jgi:ABC-2 type transport system ATP-binding protein